jgi:hypothetical protein
VINWVVQNLPQASRLSQAIKEAAYKSAMPMLDDHSTFTIERSFDVANGLTEGWFQNYASELASHTAEPEDINCQVRLGSDMEQLATFRNRKAWSDYVLSNWRDVVETSISQYGTPVVAWSSCNHRLHRVLLRVRADIASDVERTFEQLRTALSLEVSTQKSYRYRRASLEFEIGNWRPDYFASGIRQIAAFLGPDPDVPEAYAKSFQGEIEELTPFYDVKSFCETVGKRASLFGEVFIRMRARSIDVGIGVSADHKKLRIRTSLLPDHVDELIGAWPDQLKLKSVKAADTGTTISGAAPGSLEKPWLKYGLPLLGAIVTAASVSSVVTFKKAIWPDYKVIISSPIVENGVANWPGNVVSINWYLQPVQQSFSGVLNDVIGTVQVQAPYGSLPSREAKPPVAIPLAPGTYVVSVNVPGATPAYFELVVRSPSSQPVDK